MGFVFIRRPFLRFAGLCNCVFQTTLPVRSRGRLQFGVSDSGLSIKQSFDPVFLGFVRGIEDFVLGLNDRAELIDYVHEAFPL